MLKGTIIAQKDMIRPRVNTRKITGEVASSKGTRVARGTSPGSMDGPKTKLSIVIKGRRERSSRSKSKRKAAEASRIHSHRLVRLNLSLIRVETQIMESKQKDTDSLRTNSIFLRA